MSIFLHCKNWSTSFLILNYFWEQGQLGLSLTLPVFKYWVCYIATWWNMKCSSTLFLVLNHIWQKIHFCHLPYVHFLVTIQISLLCMVLVDVLISSSLFTFFFTWTIQSSYSVSTVHRIMLKLIKWSLNCKDCHYCHNWENCMTVAKINDLFLPAHCYIWIRYSSSLYCPLIGSHFLRQPPNKFET